MKQVMKILDFLQTFEYLMGIEAKGSWRQEPKRWDHLVFHRLSLAAIFDEGKIFEDMRKILSFIPMATLTRYNTFKSLKQNSSLKAKKVANHKKIAEAEMEAFLQLVSKTKSKKA